MTPASTATQRPYTLRCRGCHRSLEDDGLVLTCPEQHPPALLLAEHPQWRFHPDACSTDLFHYADWLPVIRRLAASGKPAVYHSEALARQTGLRNLWIAFNGYWPEVGASLMTATFKELEAWTVLGRLPQNARGTLVLASAGNTAAAFARACSLARRPCLIVVPESGLAQVDLADADAAVVKIVALAAPADYSDAIALAGWLSDLDGYYPEGGVLNVARRAGLGTVLLRAVEVTGRIPDYYFQAVGSGAGAIGVYEMAERLVRDGRYGDRIPRLMLSQNLPFTPLYDAWRSGSRRLVPTCRAEARRRTGLVAASVLSNREPAYGITGGVYDILTCSGGDMFAVENRCAEEARRLFRRCEGTDIDPAAAVALASLLQATAAGRIEADAHILLNITGGGRDRLRRIGAASPTEPHLRLEPDEFRRERVLERVTSL